MTGPQPTRDRIVVTFGTGPADGWCTLSHCPMHAHGPYTQEEAEGVAERLPAWMQPHILTIASDNDACLRVAQPQGEPA